MAQSESGAEARRSALLRDTPMGDVSESSPEPSSRSPSVAPEAYNSDPTRTAEPGNSESTSQLCEVESVADSEATLEETHKCGNLFSYTMHKLPPAIQNFRGVKMAKFDADLTKVHSSNEHVAHHPYLCVQGRAIAILLKLGDDLKTHPQLPEITPLKMGKTTYGNAPGIDKNARFEGYSEESIPPEFTLIGLDHLVGGSKKDHIEKNGGETAYWISKGRPVIINPLLDFFANSKNFFGRRSAKPDYFTYEEVDSDEEDDSAATQGESSSSTKQSQDDDDESEGGEDNDDDRTVVGEAGETGESSASGATSGESRAARAEARSATKSGAETGGTHTVVDEKGKVVLRKREYGYRTGLMPGDPLYAKVKNAQMLPLDCRPYPEPVTQGGRLLDHVRLYKYISKAPPMVQVKLSHSGRIFTFLISVMLKSDEAYWNQVIPDNWDSTGPLVIRTTPEDAWGHEAYLLYLSGEGRRVVDWSVLEFPRVIKCVKIFAFCTEWQIRSLKKFCYVYLKKYEEKSDDPTCKNPQDFVLTREQALEIYKCANGDEVRFLAIEMLHIQTIDHYSGDKPEWVWKLLGEHPQMAMDYAKYLTRVVIANRELDDSFVLSGPRCWYSGIESSQKGKLGSYGPKEGILSE